MKRFLIITNNEKKKNIESAEEIIRLIEDRGGEVSWKVMPGPNDLSPIEVPRDCDAVITVGGDGTMVRSAQRTIGSGVPLIGVNRGHLGYLCDIGDKNLVNSIDLLMEGRYHTEKRMMLKGYVTMGGQKDDKLFHSLNDIVITSKNGQVVIRLNIYVNGTFLYAFDGDGIIIATPTGSTAYNLSAAGPIVEPKTELMLITPINPHSLNTRSIVLDSSDEIVVKVESRRSGKRDFAAVAFDGAHRQSLSDSDTVTITKASEKTSFIRLDESSFLERMQTRLGG